MSALETSVSYCATKGFKGSSRSSDVRRLGIVVASEFEIADMGFQRCCGLGFFLLILLFFFRVRALAGLLALCGCAGAVLRDVLAGC